MAYGATLTLPTITGSHTDFPVVLKESDFPTGAKDGGANSLLNGGGDLRAYTSDAKTTQLPLDVVTFVTGGTPDIVVWVKVPTAATGNTIYIEADAVATTQPAVTNTYGRNAVWSDYEAVLHLNESGDGTAGEFVDSTGNSHDGQLTVGTSISSVSTGHPFGSTWVDLTGSHVITLASSSGLVDTSAFTVQIWANADTVSNVNGLLGSWQSSGDTDRVQINSSSKSWAHDSSGTSVSYDASGTTRTAGANESSAVVADGTDVRYYLDTLLLDTDVGDLTELVGVYDFKIGTYYDGTTFGRYNGRACEARIRKSALSANWLSTENDNQGTTAAWTTASAWADSGGSTYTLACDSGTYTATGTDADLIKDSTLTADSGSYVYSGTAVDLIKGVALTADSGAYIYTGTIVDLVGSGSLVMGSGTYAYTGTDTTLEYNAIMAADSGTYNYTGTAASLTYGNSLQLDSGSYAVTGTAIDFNVTSVVSLDSGAYNYTGDSVSLVFSGGTWTIQPDSTTSWTAQTDSTTTWTIQ